MMYGADLKTWRRRNNYTQEALRLALGLGSRQTIITWEQSERQLDKVVELALIALEHVPEKAQWVTGYRYLQPNTSSCESDQMNRRLTQLDFRINLVQVDCADCFSKTEGIRNHP